LNQNSDVFLGYIAWAAGSFDTAYVLSLTPTQKNGKYIDNSLTTQCVVNPWLGIGSSNQVIASKMTTVTLTSTRTRVIGTVTSGIVTTITTEIPVTASYNPLYTNQSGRPAATGGSQAKPSTAVQLISAASESSVPSVFVSGLAAALSMYIMLIV